jgi:hypothetical protein
MRSRVEILRSAQNDPSEDVILNPSTIAVSLSHFVILSNAKDLVPMGRNVTNSLRTGSVKDLWQ